MKVTTAIDRYIHKSEGKTFLDTGELSFYMKLQQYELNLKTAQDVKKFFEKGDYSKVEEYVKLEVVEYELEELEKDFA